MEKYFSGFCIFFKRSDEDWLLDRKITQGLIDKLTPDYDFEIRYPKEMIAPLKRIIDLAESKGTEVELLVNPYFPAFEDKMTNLDEFVAAIEKATGKKDKRLQTGCAGSGGFW